MVNLLKKGHSLAGFALGTALILVLSLFHPAFAADLGVSYQTHVQNVGWTDFVADGQTSGSLGEGQRLEAIKINLTGENETVNVSYRTHVQDQGWQSFVSAGELSGTEGQAKRLEAIEIKLDGQGSESYSIWYRVHIQDYGWLDWASDGHPAGSEGLGKRLEAIEIQIKAAGEPAPGKTENAFIAENENIASEQAVASSDSLNYRPFLNTTGWNPNYSQNGEESGGADRIEAFQVKLSDGLYPNGGIVYRAFGENGQWTGWTENDGVCGEAGVGLQAVRLKLTGKLAYMYDLYYRVHSPETGWTNWARNGAVAGSEGYNRNISHIQILLTGKAEVPGQLGDSYQQGPWQWPLPGNDYITSHFGFREGSHHDGMDIGASSGTPIHSAKTGTVVVAGELGNFGNCVAVEHDSGETVYYAHMLAVGVTLGQRVNRGDVIGYVGSTGHSTGPHLHMEVYSDTDEMVNPLNYY